MRLKHLLLYNKTEIMKTTNSNFKTSYLTSIILLIFSSASAQQWQNVSPTGYNYFSTASFINDKEGWISARYGIWPDDHTDLVHTVDGAATFQSVYTFADTLDIYILQMVDSLNGFARIAGNPGSGRYLWATYDGGHSWQDITDSAMSEPNGALHASTATYFIDKHTGFLGGSNSIYKTTDGGNTWEIMNTPQFIDSTESNLYWPNRIFFHDKLYGWATCSMFMDAGFVLKTMDGGQNWIACKPISGALYNIHFVDTLHGGTTGGDWNYSLVMLTDNNFDTISHFYKNQWQQLPDAIYYQTYSTIWMSGWPAVIYKSTDGGASFVEYDNTYATDNQTDWLHDFQFFDSTGYAFAYSFILKMVDTLHTSVNPLVQINDLNIIPNPAKNKCVVSLVSKNAGNSAVRLYSVDGILVLNTEWHLIAGKNELLLDISNLKQGIYLL